SFASGRFVDHIELQPKNLGRHSNRIVGDLIDELWPTKHIDHLYRFRNVAHAGEATLTQNLLAAPVHRDHPMPLGPEQGSHTVAVAVRVGRTAYHRDRARSSQDLVNYRVRGILKGTHKIASVDQRRIFPDNA